MNDLSVDTIIDALGFIDPDQDRKSWARIGMAIKSELGESGFSIFDDWSKGGSKYNKADAKSTWRSVRQHASGQPVTIATLIYEAQQSGFAFNDNDRVKISAEEIEARKTKREAEERKAAAELKRIQGEVARLANLAWESATTAYEHPYTKRKGVNPIGLRMGQFPVYKEPDHGQPVTPFKHIPALLVPIHDKKGKIVSLQAYFDGDVEPYGDRAYLKAGKKQDGYCLLGTPRERIAIAEGYATGASVHMATGWAVYVAFDSGNLTSVAKTAREWFPQAEIIIAGDNDAPNPQNGKPGAGITAAQQAGQAVNGRVIFPHNVGDDWNDVHVRDGLEAVQSALMAHMLPKPANDNAPREIDFYTPLPSLTSSGKPRSTIENAQEIIDRLGVTVRYNVIKKEDEILIPGESFTVDNQANASLARLISRFNEFGMPTGNIGEYITYLADTNPHNPVATWINSKPWDGVSRINDFFQTITPVQPRTLPDGTIFQHALMRRWMLSAVAAAFQPNGVVARGVLVLQGEQNLGKTKWFKSLAPAELDVLQDGMQLKPDDRDSVKQIVSYWLVELGELDATFKKSDIAALKAFISRGNDVMRRAYARLESNYARRTVFFGSVNPREFLHDPTGNTRYWTIECAAINHTHGIDMQQVWAEMYALYQQGESWYLSNDEMAMLNHSNEDFQVVDPIHERILSKLNWDEPQTAWRWVTATDLLIELGIDRPTQGEVTKAANFIRSKNDKQARRSNGKNLLLTPPKIRFMGDDYDRPF